MGCCLWGSECISLLIAQRNDKSQRQFSLTRQDTELVGLVLCIPLRDYQRRCVLNPYAQKANASLSNIQPLLRFAHSTRS
jgi:hypothetical protein